MILVKSFKSVEPSSGIMHANCTIYQKTQHIAMVSSLQIEEIVGETSKLRLAPYICLKLAQPRKQTYIASLFLNIQL
jgi:hypothetical protein